MKKRLSSSARTRVSGKGRVTLQRALSKLGFCSRSEAVETIARGSVTLNGIVVTDPARWVDLSVVQLAVNGKAPTRSRPQTIVFHKPAGVVTTASDERDRPTIYDVLPEEFRSLKPVGRLDVESTGALLLTNDHRLLNALTDPESWTEKEYEVVADRVLRDEDLRIIRAGIEITLKGKVVRSRPAVIRQSAPRRYAVVLTEGKNRQVRRMFEACDAAVVALRRVRVGPIMLGDLPEGGFRILSADEVAALRDVSSGRLRTHGSH